MRAATRIELRRQEGLPLAYADSDGTRIYWEVQGRGEPLVLIMGLGYSSKLWLRLRPHLEPHFTVWAVNRRGRGDSGDGDGYSLDREFEELKPYLVTRWREMRAATSEEP